MRLAEPEAALLSRPATVPGFVASALALGCALAALLCPASGFASEVCHYTGTTEYQGKVDVVTEVSTTGGSTRVDVAMTLDAVWMKWFHVHYLLEEISSWRGGDLDSIAVNSRYILNKKIVRQQWDRFHREDGAMQAERVQAKTLDDFNRHHTAFVRHWDPATFAEPWGQDYQAANPERRADLDLAEKPLPPRLRSPLALVFYWLPRDQGDVTVFLPGFKKDKTTDVTFVPAASAEGPVWRIPLRYTSFSGPPSMATARLSSDGHLLQLAAEVHGWAGSARGQIELTGCNTSRP